MDRIGILHQARRALAGSVLALLLAACAAALPETAPPLPTTEGYPGPGTAFPTPLPPAEGYPLSTEAGAPAATAAFSGPAEALVAQAMADLALRAGVDPGSIQVVEVSEQSWPDASLGCPQEGQLYAQVVTEGYRIILEAGGQRYAYHTDRALAVYCAEDQP